MFYNLLDMGKIEYEKDEQLVDELISIIDNLNVSKDVYKNGIVLMYSFRNINEYKSNYNFLINSKYRYLNPRIFTKIPINSLNLLLSLKLRFAGSNLYFYGDKFDDKIFYISKNLLDDGVLDTVLIGYDIRRNDERRSFVYAVIRK